MHGIVMRFGEHEGGVTGVNRTIERPIDRETAKARLAGGKAVVVGIKRGGTEESFVLHDPAIDYVHAEIWGQPRHPGNSAHLRFATSSPGSVSLVSAHYPCDVFDPDVDEFRWSESVFLQPPWRRRAVLDLRSHKVWLVQSLAADPAIAELAGREFPLATFEDYAALVTPWMADSALLDPARFDPGQPGGNTFLPDEDLEEAERLMEECGMVHPEFDLGIRLAWPEDWSRA